jgi:ATP/maltotriose-dependent transcriptional regulator MalT
VGWHDPLPMTATEAPFDLMEVKLAQPATRPGTVAKTDVIARLGAATVPFVTVVAPAGYGKTTPARALGRG